MQVLEHLGLPQHLPIPDRNNTTILLPTLIGKESTFLEYVIDIICEIELQEIYPAYYQPENSELSVQLGIKA